jgi:hypothetical protein
VYGNFHQRRNTQMSNDTSPSGILYSAMKYVAIATFLFYSKGIDTDCTTVSEFREKNPEVVKRVFDETLNVFQYELSWSQVDSAIVGFLTALKNPLDVKTTEIYTPNQDNKKENQP